MYKKIDIVIQEFTRIAMPIFFYPIFISSTQTYRDTADNIFPSALKDRRDHLSQRSFLVQGP